MLAGRDIGKRFDGNAAILQDVSIEISRGKATVLLGASGSGKSTLIRALALLDPPDTGSVAIDGDWYSFPQKGKKAITPWPAVTVVFQSLFLFPHLSLGGNILLPLEGQMTPARKDWIDHLVQAMAIGDLLKKFPNQASVGQRQRVALVRALALEPRYVLLDEITSALDVEHVAAVAKLLSEIKARDVGILVSTHLLGFAREIGDQFVFLDHGRVAESGDIATLSKSTHGKVRQFITQTSVD